jgi:hypothetical protein
MCFTPVFSLCALFWVKNPLHRAYITLYSGIGGIVWLLVFFGQGAIHQNISSEPSTCYESSPETATPGFFYDCSYDNIDSHGISIALFVFGGLFTILDIVLICVGALQIKRLNKVLPSASELIPVRRDRRARQKPSQIFNVARLI